MFRRFFNAELTVPPHAINFIKYSVVQKVHDPMFCVIFCGNFIFRRVFFTNAHGFAAPGRLQNYGFLFHREGCFLVGGRYRPPNMPARSPLYDLPSRIKVT